MEPDVIPLHSSSPPPLDDDGDGELGSEEDEFGDFSVGVSCSPLGFADSAELPSLTLKPATHRPSCSFNHPVEQSQPTSTVNLESDGGQTDMEGQDCDAKSSLHLTNGFAERHHNSGAHSAPTAGACSPEEETGFADFTVFTEQAAHPWCCGFSPMSSTEQWDGRVGGTNHSLGEQICHSGQDVIMESEPRSHCAYKADKNVCTEVKHCENRDPACAQPSQDHHQPQEAAAALNFPSGEEERGKPGDSRRERRPSFDSLRISDEQEDEGEENKENSVSSLPQTFSMYASASEASFGDDLSFEGVSADLEPNVSSLVSHDDQTDWDGTDDEDEGELGLPDSFVSRTGRLSQSESETGFHHCKQYATQETCATSNQSQPGANTEGRFADSSVEHHRDQELQTADVGVQSLGNLPPSDSFADFCSAPTQGDGQGSWAEFKDQSAQGEEKPWTQFRDPVSSLQIDGNTEEEQDRAGQQGGSRRNSCQASLSCRVQQLLQASFPEVVVPVVEGEEELLGLSALLQTRHLPEREEAAPELSGALWIQQEMLSPHRDVHSAVGLQFQWGGSHTNRTLLRCLSVDTRNIVFIGTKKQPVTVPAFASGLGMLEPTKDSVAAVGSPGHTAVTAQAPPGRREIPDPSTHSVQEELPSSQLDWSSRGLSSSQDGCSALNLDYFGPEQEGRSSSSSRSNSPPPGQHVSLRSSSTLLTRFTINQFSVQMLDFCPLLCTPPCEGVDRELYQLTISKLETSDTSSHLEDALNRLMSTTEKTSVSVRKPVQDGELSAEAGRMIAGLPDLSFMQAKVLMFPSILVPENE
uniref:Aftiphilin clathrin-binding box domain-containing protein n=1 Tax=Stegastes partitus TaxID=144197 RepID=A0A3B5ABD5_9TELE